MRFMSDSAGYTQHPELWLGRSSGLVNWSTAKSDAAELVQRCENLPILIKAAAFTSTTTADHTHNMAICVLGTGHDWTLQESSGRLHSRVGCH